MSLLHTPFEVIDYWFNELHPHQWFEGGEDIDREVTQRFSTLLEEASRGELYIWRKSALGRLAEIIILDQFTRHIHRGTARAYENDREALILAEELVQLGQDKELPSIQRAFAYLPFMHSESKVIHQMALKLYTELGDQENLDYEIRHKELIDHFGRYPQRNEALGRESTEEEKEFLKNNKDF